MSIPAPRSGAAALITGASSGIGAAIAGQLCARGHDAILVARRADRLSDLANELASLYGRQVHTIPTDLADELQRRELWAQVQHLGLEIDVAVLSAGFGIAGPFIANDAERVQTMIRTNVESTMLITHAVLGGMVERRAGAILIVSSMTGHQPMPYFGAYAATKAAVTSFAEMLGSELSESGVTVTAICPGAVRTEFVAAGGLDQLERATPDLMTIDADACARYALDGLDRGDRVVMPRAAVRALTFFAGHAPRSVWLPLCKRMMSL